MRNRLTRAFYVENYTAKTDNARANATVLPENLSGFQQIYNGSYSSTVNDNKISVTKVVTAELCGQSTDVRKFLIGRNSKVTFFLCSSRKDTSKFRLDHMVIHQKVSVLFDSVFTRRMKPCITLAEPF